MFCYSLVCEPKSHRPFCNNRPTLGLEPIFPPYNGGELSIVLPEEHLTKLCPSACPLVGGLRGASPFMLLVDSGWRLEGFWRAFYPLCHLSFPPYASRGKERLHRYQEQYTPFRVPCSGYCFALTERALRHMVGPVGLEPTTCRL